MPLAFCTHIAQTAIKSQPLRIASAHRYRPVSILLSRSILNITNGAQRRSMASKEGKPKKALAVPRPSSSVLLISPNNEVLLLHRVKTSSSFPSAHVFPGGNLSASQDGEIPEVDSPERHQDGRAYRLCAIRETFEESGILLAYNNGFGRLIEVPDKEREQGRHDVHSEKVKFETWLAGKGGRADVDGLIPFTRWVTPTNVPKRFTTQMYIYFLPLESTEQGLEKLSSQSSGASIPSPTSDGGLEHTTAQFKPPLKWVEMARAGEIILFPPQMVLLHKVGQFLATAKGSPFSRVELGLQRQALRDFVKTDDPPWTEKCISPTRVMMANDRRQILGLDKPGPELESSGRRGIHDIVVFVDFRKEGPRDVEVGDRAQVFKEQRESGSKL